MPHFFCQDCGYPGVDPRYFDDEAANDIIGPMCWACWEARNNVINPPENPDDISAIPADSVPSPGPEGIRLADEDAGLVPRDRPPDTPG